MKQNLKDRASRRGGFSVGYLQESLCQLTRRNYQFTETHPTYYSLIRNIYITTVLFSLIYSDFQRSRSSTTHQRNTERMPLHFGEICGDYSFPPRRRTAISGRPLELPDLSLGDLRAMWIVRSTMFQAQHRRGEGLSASVIGPDPGHCDLD